MPTRVIRMSKIKDGRNSRPHLNTLAVTLSGKKRPAHSTSRLAVLELIALYNTMGSKRNLVEMSGLEPPTSWLQTRRSPS